MDFIIRCFKLTNTRGLGTRPRFVLLAGTSQISLQSEAEVAAVIGNGTKGGAPSGTKADLTVTWIG